MYARRYIHVRPYICIHTQKYNHICMYMQVVFVATAVGVKSQWGKIRANLVSEPGETPLQEKLADAAKLIGSVLVVVGVVVVVVGVGVVGVLVLVLLVLVSPNQIS
jgi:magnesium-transporting ATPase (P-type)